ncbi:MAG TPA: 3-methyl-2-oxobutanoate hydroxymethyltransferase [Arcobacter sp.]|nr:3-methyl-2-oxobutanoate hydroxymethyltransferase [Arcobacter sp.]HIP55830.1 3-methyl-2-oxobutanoate hydroxymethyltransferase [Arcobacter sp.]
MKQTITSIQKAKGNRKLSMITAYDALFAKLFDEQVDFILVGDSLNMSFAGHEDTLSATLDQMIYHTQAVCKGAPNTFVICDMPFGTYTNKKDALKNCIKVFQETNASAVKIEGGSSKANIIKELTSNSISVCGHIGLMPQNVRIEGGYKVKGKDEQSIKTLIQDAIDIQNAGAFAIVLEGVKEEASKQITKAVNIPIIGIGAGVEVDGQVLVWSDMLGLFEAFKPKFVREYINGANIVKDAVSSYVKDVQSLNFPNESEKY